jgi:TolB protein
VFSTRIAYVTKGGDRFTLRIADADGEGGQVALNSPEPIISPAWSPDGRELAYVSFESQKAVVYTQEVASGQAPRDRELPRLEQRAGLVARRADARADPVARRRLAALPDGPQWRCAAAASRTASAIDTEPAFSPDGTTIYFVSDRGGSPQVYRMPAGGGTPSASPSPAATTSARRSARTAARSRTSRAGQRLPAAHDGRAGGGAPQALDRHDDDESPSFAPNGRLIIYATRAGGRDVLMTTTLDGKIKARLVSTTADVREPVWGPSVDDRSRWSKARKARARAMKRTT